MNTNKLNSLLFALIVILAILFGAHYKYTCDKNAVRFYNQGLDLYKQEKYSDAYYNFKQIKSFSKLYELSLLKQYQCANNLADKKTALIKLREIIKTTKHTDIKPWALYSEAMLSQEMKVNDDIQLARKFKYIQENFPESDFGIASAYKAAHLSIDTEPTSAKASYLKYLSYAPSGKFSINSIEELSKLEVVFSKEDFEIIADSKFANGQYQSALEFYKKTSFSKNWFKIAKCYRNLKDKNNEKEIILKGFDLSSSFIEEKEISNAIDRYISLTGTSKQQGLQDLYVKYPNSYIFPTVAFKLAEVSASLRAIKLYELLANDYPNSIWASNALWEVFWHNYLEGRYQNCVTYAKKHITLYEKTQDSPRIAYWYAKTLLKLKRNQQAREMLYDIISTYPMSYYSFLSARQLKMSKAKKMIVKKPIAEYDKDDLNKFIFEDKTLLLLADLGDWELIDDFKIDNEYIKSWITHKKGNYPIAINIAKEELSEFAKNEKISFSNQMLKLVYPLYFEKEINQHALAQKQRPYLFLSLIREESHFNKNAKSSADAYGLSQLLPSTASFIEKKTVSKETLLNPSENIRIGLKYFDYLYNQFNKNEYLAILAYNAGPGNIKKWLSSPNIISDEIDVFVENVPYLETKNYIKKILSSYWIYLNIYSAKNK